MKKIVLPVMMLVASTVMTVSCKKKKDDDYTPPVTTPTLLCDGNGTSSYFPLSNGNKYVYGYKLKGNAKWDKNYTITKDTIIGGQTYKKLQNDSVKTIYELIRTDLANNNVYSYISALSKEVILVPGTPAIDQVIEVATPGNTAKVTSVSAAFKTASCSYSGLLEITEFDSKGKAIAVFQYKQGVGRVHTAFVPTGGDTEDLQLKSVVLN